MLEERDVGQRVMLGDADGLAELADGGRRVAATAHTRDRWHARIVPAGDALLLHELEQVALRHDGVGQVEAGELDLLRLGRGVERAQEPIVERTVHLELERADGMGDAFVRILQGVGVVVHRVDAPLIAGVMVVRLADAVDDRVAHVHVRRRHVDLGAQHGLAFVVFSAGHALERREVLLHRRIARGAGLAAMLLVAVVFADLLLRKEADISLAELDQLNGVRMHAVEVVRCLVVVLPPVETEPADVFLDRIDVLDLFLGRVGVVHAQVAAALILQREAEVEADGLGVADVQVAVRLRRETRDDLGVLTGREVGVDDLLDEVAMRFGRHGKRG